MIYNRFYPQTNRNLKVLYHRTTSKTAKQIARNLGIGYTKTPENNKVVVRWGSSTYAQNDFALQPRSSIRLAVRGHRAVEVMGENGIPVAEVYHTPPQDESLYPLVGRGRINHKAGADIKIVEAPAEARESGCKYFLSFFEADRELRVHVVNGEAVKGFRKVPREDDAHKKIRTSKFGWGYKRVNLEKYYPKCAETAVKAVEALGLIYGGVDIARNRQGEVLVFEVNTGPALNIKTVTYYTDLFAKHLQGLNAEGVIEYESPQ